ncbi:MAG: HAD-IB family phosphatase [Acidithiobacillus sp.]|uniref:HAD-IB family phosphatase n=1 Tax=Acidithiobacillus sp. TaxID=1872118 RepID=UPI003CFBE25E
MSGRWIFCDFDGTIVEDEIFVALLRRFAPAESERVLPEIYALRLSLRDGLRRILETIPSDAWPQMEDFVRSSARLRHGFAEFAQKAQATGWSLAVVTGGFQAMAELVLEPFRSAIAAVHGLEVDRSGAFLRPFSPWEGGGELVSKPAVYAHYAPDTAICIGDSVTDLALARQCPRVFARDRLAEYLQREDRAWERFDTFFDILPALEPTHAAP